MTDPVWSERASPVSFVSTKRVRQPGIPFDSLPPIDVVLMSHNHYEHMDVATLKKLAKKYNPMMYMGLGVTSAVKRCIGKHLEKLHC
jgi:L-ascorbate metabolism protein UlaG (beta-lactamase superfamily)